MDELFGGDTGVPLTDASFINPFILGIIETLKIQCSVVPRVGKPYNRGKKHLDDIDIAAEIKLTSQAFQGTLAICFPENTFLKIMEGMLGEKFPEIDDDLVDGAGELLNIIFGFAKRILNDNGHDIEIAIPNVFMGEEIGKRDQSQANVGLIPFSSDAGNFYMEIAMMNGK